MFRLSKKRYKFTVCVLGLMSIWILYSIAARRKPKETPFPLSGPVDTSQIPSGPVQYVPGIPYKVHTTSKTYIPMPTWIELNPGLPINFYTDTTMDVILETNLELFKKLDLAILHGLKKIEKSDLLRYVAVYLQGGIYADSDVDCLTPIRSWLDRIGPPNVDLNSLDFIVGIEFEYPVFYSSRGHTIQLPFQVTQFTFAACQGSYFMREVIDEVEEQILNISNGDTSKDKWLILQRTGPRVFTKALLQLVTGKKLGSYIDYPKELVPLHVLNKRGQLIEKMIDGKIVKGLILPKRAFGMRKSKRHLAILTHHNFQGSWKDKKIWEI